MDKHITYALTQVLQMRDVLQKPVDPCGPFVGWRARPCVVVDRDGCERKADLTHIPTPVRAPRPRPSREQGKPVGLSSRFHGML